jgi:hypothetical protein
MGEEAKRKRAARWRLFITITTFVALAVFIILARVQIIDTFKNLGKVNTLALLLIIPLQAINYHAYTKLYQHILRIIGTDVDYKKMFKVTLELNFVNNIFPSGGFSGFTYVSLRLKSKKITTAQATLAQVMRFGLVFTSYQLLMAFGLFLLAINGRANRLMILIAGSLATLLFILTAGIAFIAGSKQRINSFVTFVPKALNDLIRIIKPSRKEAINMTKIEKIFTELHENYLIIKDNFLALRKPLFFALLANITELLTIYTCYIAFGRWVNPGAVIIAYAIANFAGLISVLPGGIGVYEGLTTATLAAAGISASLSLPVTVMYRVLANIVQLPPGYYYYHKNLKANKQQASGSVL